MSKFTCIICGESVYADHDCRDKILTGHQPIEQAEKGNTKVKNCDKRNNYKQAQYVISK